jgi:hypothetical protein
MSPTAQVVNVKFSKSVIASKFSFMYSEAQLRVDDASTRPAFSAASSSPPPPILLRHHFPGHAQRGTAGGGVRCPSSLCSVHTSRSCNLASLATRVHPCLATRVHPCVRVWG